MASWDVDELESWLLYREEDKDGIETEIRRISGNPSIQLCELGRERWPCGDVGPMDMRGMVRIASLFEEGSVLGFCDFYSEFHRLETNADGKVLVKRLSAGDVYEALDWDDTLCAKQHLYDGEREDTGEKRC